MVCRSVEKKVKILRKESLAWHNADEYPSTGIIDPRFPLEEGAPAVTAARYYVNQIIYPFKTLVPDSNMRITVAKSPVRECFTTVACTYRCFSYCLGVGERSVVECVV